MDTPDLEGLFDEHGVPIFEGGDSFDISDMKGIIYNDAEIDSIIPLATEEAEKVITKTATPFRDMLGRANARGMSVLEQSMDLMADVSHGARTTNVTGAIGDFIPQTISNLKPVMENITKHNTADKIIESMKVAQGAVKSMSRGKQAAIGIGSLSAIGAVSNRSLKKRRG